jgi:DNA-binding response OmpR family regulator
MNKKILVVDDDQDIIDAIKIILEKETYAVSIISKGDEIYTQIDTFKPDLVLLDVLMSGHDGRTISKNIKSDKVSSHIPIVMMSAHPSAIKEYIECGADDFLAKPFETEELIGIIKKNLK